MPTMNKYELVVASDEDERELELADAIGKDSEDTETTLPDDEDDYLGESKNTYLGVTRRSTSLVLAMLLMFLVVVMCEHYLFPKHQTVKGNWVTSVHHRTTGFVIIDIRTDGVLGERVRKLMTQLEVMFDLPIELWVGPATIELDNLEEQLGSDLMKSLQLKDRLSIREMKKTHTYKNLTVDLTGIMGGHIGKAWAIRESAFDVPVNIDTDVWPCNTEVLSVVNETIGNGNFDLVWSAGPKSHTATKHKNDVYVTPEIADDLKEFKKFKERNSGTVFAVNRLKPDVQDWLYAAMDIFTQQTHSNLLNQPYTDQGAFRESLFLYRHTVREYLLAADLACRRSNALHHSADECKCPCDCEKCILVHKKAEFEMCAEEYFPDL